MSKLTHGAVEVTLGGKSYTLVPNLNAYEVCLDAEYEVNNSLTLKSFPAVNSLLRTLDIRFMERLVRAAGDIKDEGIREAIFQFGVANLPEILGSLVDALLDPNQNGTEEKTEESKAGE